MKNGVALKSLGEKSCEIKGGDQEMAAMMLMLKKNFLALFLALTSLQPFSPRLFKATPFFHSLAVFVWIIINIRTLVYNTDYPIRLFKSSSVTYLPQITNVFAIQMSLPSPAKHFLCTS